MDEVWESVSEVLDLVDERMRCWSQLVDEERMASGRTYSHTKIQHRPLQLTKVTRKWSIT